MLASLRGEHGRWLIYGGRSAVAGECSASGGREGGVSSDARGERPNKSHERPFAEV